MHANQPTPRWIRPGRLSRCRRGPKPDGGLCSWPCRVAGRGVIHAVPRHCPPPLHAPDRSRMRSLDTDAETSAGYATLSAPAVTAATLARRRRWRALRDRSRLACSTWFRGLNHLHDPNTLRAIRRPPRECWVVLRHARDGSSPSAAASPKARLGRRTRRVSRVRSHTRSGNTRQAARHFPERRLSFGGAVHFMRSQQCAVAC